MSKALIPLDVIASDIASDLEDSTGRYKFKITRHLLDGYRELNLFIGQDVEIKTQVMKCGNSVKMPSDFVYETKVGVIRNGCLAVLTLDKGTRMDRMTDSCTRDYLDSIWNGTYEGDGYYFYNAFRGSSFLGELYGMGRGVHNAGTYTIDKKEGVIHVGSHICDCDEIVVEYKSDGISNGLKLIPVELKKCLEFYAKAQFYADKNITQSQINQNKYEAAYNKVKRLYNFNSALYLANKTNEMFKPSNY